MLELIAEFEKATGEKVPHKIGSRREGDIIEIFDPLRLRKRWVRASRSLARHSSMLEIGLKRIKPG